MLLDDCAHLKTCMVNLLVIFILIDIVWIRFGQNVGVRFRECKPVLEKLVRKLECSKKGQTYANYYWHFKLFWDSKPFCWQWFMWKSLDEDLKWRRCPLRLQREKNI